MRVRHCPSAIGASVPPANISPSPVFKKKENEVSCETVRDRHRSPSERNALRGKGIITNQHLYHQQELVLQNYITGQVIAVRIISATQWSGTTTQLWARKIFPPTAKVWERIKIGKWFSVRVNYIAVSTRVASKVRDRPQWRQVKLKGRATKWKKNSLLRIELAPQFSVSSSVNFRINHRAKPSY